MEIETISDSRASGVAMGDVKGKAVPRYALFS